jgi:cyclophilin family peptidyl-prolyl cis-trans isomerase
MANACSAGPSLPGQATNDVGMNVQSTGIPTTETPASPNATASAGSSAGESGPAAALESDERAGMYDAPPEMSIDPDTYYYATIRTEKGNVELQLFADRAPKTVNNFVFLAREGYYDNTTFHRVIDGFMAQAGDPTATGGGDPGYQFEDEFFPGLEFDQPGLLAMANRGPDTNGSQFFITFGPTEWLSGYHTIFGKVIEGEDVLAQITRIDPDTDIGLVGDTIFGIDIKESQVSILPTPMPSPPTPTPTPTPTPFAPSSLDTDSRPLADVEPAQRVNYFNTPPDMIIDPGQNYQAVIATSQGDLVVQLYAQAAPVSVNNFVVLAELGFYDNTPISLVRPDDSIIFGLPDDNPLNDAGYKIAAELDANIELNVGILTYIPVESRSDGSILSSSSQILLALVQPPPDYQGQLGFFGQVVEGMDILPVLTTEDTIQSITINTSD